MPKRRAETANDLMWMPRMSAGNGLQMRDLVERLEERTRTARSCQRADRFGDGSGAPDIQASAPSVDVDDVACGGGHRFQARRVGHRGSGMFAPARGG